MSQEQENDAANGMRGYKEGQEVLKEQLAGFKNYAAKELAELSAWNHRLTAERDAATKAKDEVRVDLARAYDYAEEQRRLIEQFQARQDSQGYHQLRAENDFLKVDIARATKALAELEEQHEGFERANVANRMKAEAATKALAEANDNITFYQNEWQHAKDVRDDMVKRLDGDLALARAENKRLAEDLAEANVERSQWWIEIKSLREKLAEAKEVAQGMTAQAERNAAGWDKAERELSESKAVMAEELAAAKRSEESWKRQSEDTQAAWEKESAALKAKVEAEHELYLSAHRQNMKGATLLMDAEHRAKALTAKLAEQREGSKDFYEKYRNEKARTARLVEVLKRIECVTLGPDRATASGQVEVMLSIAIAALLADGAAPNAAAPEPKPCPCCSDSKKYCGRPCPKCQKPAPEDK